MYADGRDVVFSEGEATHISAEVDKFLQGHAVRRCLVVSGKQLFFIADFVDVLPTTARERFKNGGPANVIEQGLPIGWIREGVERGGIDIDVFRKALFSEE